MNTDKKSGLFGLLLLLILGAGVLPATPKLNQWRLVWADEFEYNGLPDPAKWRYDVGGHGWGNKELQYYTERRKENARVENGSLIIEARKDGWEGHEYTSARLVSKGKGDWTYGRFEARAKLPSGRGTWPAIWMLPTGWEYGSWPNSGEIDIMELLGHEPNVVHGTLHYGDRQKRHQSKGQSFKLEKGTFADDFHVFRLDWEPKQVRWYVDGKLYQTQSEWHTRDAPFPAPFDQRFHLILNVAVGGNWPGNPDEKTQFPQAMVVDWVRVYQPR